MIIPSGGVRMLVATTPVGFRKSLEGLAELVREAMGGDPSVLDPPGRGQTKTGQLFAYAPDDRPWGGSDPPGVAYVYAADRKAERPIADLRGFTGILQACPEREAEGSPATGGYGRLRRLQGAGQTEQRAARLLLEPRAP